MAFAPGALAALRRREAVVAWTCRDGLLRVSDEETRFPADARVVGRVPALDERSLGDAAFLDAHGVRYPYVAGALAGGIASAEMVVAMSRGGMMGGFGAGGLPLPRVRDAIREVQAALGGAQNYEFNLLHSPFDPAHEAEAAELYLAERVHRISASGYMRLTPPLVRFRAAGMARGPGGEAIARNLIMAKVSRPEVAREFLSPCPAAILRSLVRQGQLSAAQAELAARLPVADDVTVEADSGGHTDNQALVPLLSSILALRDRLTEQHGYASRPRVGAAGGISTPAALAAAFVAGAAYVLTGSINQACVEASTSAAVKRALCDAGPGSTDMAPAGDMFEIGARVQVLKHRTLFAARARMLYEVWRQHDAWEDVAERDRTQIETRVFRKSFDEVWDEVRAYLEARRPADLATIAGAPKQRLAAVCKWYMHHSSRWAIEGSPDRAADYQVWCGPAMSSFNEWVRGTFLEGPDERRVVVVARNLLAGAVAVLRARILALQGVALPSEAFTFTPQRLAGDSRPSLVTRSNQERELHHD